METGIIELSNKKSGGETWREAWSKEYRISDIIDLLRFEQEENGCETARIKISESGELTIDFDGVEYTFEE